MENKTIKVGNTILQKDKIVGLIVKGNKVIVYFIMGQSITFCYDTPRDAYSVFEEMNRQLNQHE
jgi:hypothetical protein